MDMFKNKPEDKKAIFNEDAMKEFKKHLLKSFAYTLKTRVLSDVLPSLGPKNFEGEAINYLRKKNIPLTEKVIKEFSTTILQEFRKNIDDMVVYDEETNMLTISPFIAAFEYGDMYRPILKTLSRAIEEAYKPE